MFSTAIGIAIIVAAILGIVCIVLALAPIGYEDQTGFHRGEPNHDGFGEDFWP